MIEKFEDWTNPFEKPEDEPGYQWFFVLNNSNEESSLGRWVKVPVVQYTKDSFTWGNQDYKPKEEIEGLSTEIDYDLIKNVINSDNPDAKKIAVFLKEMTEQKLKKLEEPYCVGDFDFDITEENEDHFIQWIVANTYSRRLITDDRFYLANAVANSLSDSNIFDYIFYVECDYEKTNARFESIKQSATEHVRTLMLLDEFINK